MREQLLKAQTGSRCFRDFFLTLKQAINDFFSFTNMSVVDEE